MPVMPDFRPVTPIAGDVMRAYADLVPPEVTELWEQHGTGTFANGLLQVVDPGVFGAAIEGTYVAHGAGVPIFVTGMADVIVWKDGLFRMLKYRKGVVEVVAKSFRVVLAGLSSKRFVMERLDGRPFFEAVDANGPLAHDASFGYVPLLGLGGPERLENLQKMKTVEHIAIITQLMGALVF